MARRAVVDREELFQAAEELAASGKEVSALALLNTLGGGSLTTIYKYLSEWIRQAVHARPPHRKARICSELSNEVLRGECNAGRR